MIKYFQKSLDFILFTNLFVAFAAVAQGLVFYYLFDVQFSFLVLAILFCATIFVYNLSVLIDRPKNYQDSKYRRVRWVYGHYRINVIISILAVLALFPLFFQLAFHSKILVIGLGILSLSYAVPIFSFRGKKFSLRNIAGIKLFLIAFVWAISVTLLPYFELQSQDFSAISKKDIFIITLKRFLFVAAITIPFDIRDMFQDKAFQLKTIPLIFGEKKAYLICQIMLLLCLILIFLFKSQGFNLNFYASAITVVLAGWLIFKSKWEKNEYYYFFYLDGLLILHYFLLLLLNFIF